MACSDRATSDSPAIEQHKRLHGDDERAVGAGRLASLDHDEGLTSTSPSWKVPPGPDEFR